MSQHLNRERFRLLNLFFFTTTFVPLKRRDGVLEWTSGSRLGLDLPMKIILYINFSLLNPRCTPGRVLSGIIGERDKGLRLLVQMSNFQHRVSSKHAQTNLDCLVRERVLHYPTVVGVVERFKVLLERGYDAFHGKCHTLQKS